MGFSNQERINMNSKALAAAVIDANPVAQWYETRNAFSFLVNGNRVLTEFSSIPAAANLAAAQANASANPTLIQDKSLTTDAIRLTAVAGTNNSTYIAYSTYNDASSSVLDNWIQPQLIPQTSGAPSIGYAIVLYDGDPASGGTQVTTTDGTTGTGQNKTVGWIWQYSSGILLLSDDFKSSVSDPYVMGFRYIGATASSGATTASSLESTFVADESIAIGNPVRIATSSDTGFTVGRVINSIASSFLGSEIVGIAKISAVQGDSVTVVTSGETSVKFASAPASASNGQNVYLDTVSGQATLTAPSGSNYITKIGKLKGANGSTATPICVLNIQEPVGP